MRVWNVQICCKHGELCWVLWVVFGCYWQRNRQRRWWNQALCENRGASLGVPTAFRHAAHDWMNDNLSDDVHNEEVCDRFNYEAERFTGMSQDDD